MPSGGQNKLTQEVAKQRAASMGFKLVGKYENLKNPLMVECKKGHKVQMRLNHIISGRSCKICNGREDELNTKTVNKKIKKYAVQLVGEYTKLTDKAKFICNKGHIFTATTGCVVYCKSESACKICNKQKRMISEKELAKRLKSAKLKLIKGARLVHEKVLVEGKCGHQWETTVRRISVGCGCPRCTSYTSDFNVIYLISVGVTVDGLELVKCGVTSKKTKKDRFRLLKIDARNASYKLPGIDIIMMGETSVKATIPEKLVLELGTKPDLPRFNGHTEFRLMSKAQIAKAVKIIKSHLKE